MHAYEQQKGTTTRAMSAEIQMNWEKFHWNFSVWNISYYSILCALKCNKQFTRWMCNGKTVVCVCATVWICRQMPNTDETRDEIKTNRKTIQWIHKYVVGWLTGWLIVFFAISFVVCRIHVLASLDILSSPMIGTNCVT